MRVDSSKPYKVIFSLNPDSELGPVIEAFAVQLNNNSTLSLTYQKLYAHTMKAFAQQLDEDDEKAIKLSTEYTLEVLSKKFSKKKDLRPQEWWDRYADEKLLKDVIKPYVEQRVAECLDLLSNKTIFLRGKTGNPAHLELAFIPEEVSVHFHFHKEEEGTRYYPTFRCGEEMLSFVNKPVQMITNRPCVLLAENKLYRFEDNLEGKKLTPFFSKWNIQIPKTAEPTYYRKFITQLVENHKVIAKGFHIYTYEKMPRPVLKLENGWNNLPQISLLFDYEKETIPASETKKILVKLEKNAETYKYHKIIRQFEAEGKFKDHVIDAGLENAGGSLYILPSENALPSGFQSVAHWLGVNKRALEKNGFRIEQNFGEKNYFFGEISLNCTIEDKNDWFDVYATVSFGDYKIPFIKLKRYILQQIHEFVLPDGKIAIIPQEWFTKYQEIMALSANNDDETLKLKRHHFQLLEGFFTVAEGIDGKWKEALLSAQSPQQSSAHIPEKFNDVLRPYQVDGVHWMQNLQQNKFGGCLADDMGLGKTVQTLALLLAEKERNNGEEEFSLPVNGQLALFSDLPSKVNHIKVRKKIPSLIVMPTSLIHNWLYEVKKWAPTLKTVNYSGLDREDRIKFFTSADLILTTYGTVRNDTDVLQQYEFNYMILDESQVIKNPLAKITKAVKTLKAKHKLTLTGTPIENSLMDLWSQLSFLNPGLLGSYQYFRDNFVVPIEKKTYRYRHHTNYHTCKDGLLSTANALSRAK